MHYPVFKRRSEMLGLGLLGTIIVDCVSCLAGPQGVNDYKRAASDPDSVGDVVLVGKFKNRKATITGFSLDENNQAVAQTDKGDHKIFKPRIAKLVPAKPRSDGVLQQAGTSSDKP
jgi:hypothetical protein